MPCTKRLVISPSAPYCPVATIPLQGPLSISEANSKVCRTLSFTHESSYKNMIHVHDSNTLTSPQANKLVFFPNPQMNVMSQWMIMALVLTNICISRAQCAYSCTDCQTTVNCAIQKCAVGGCTLNKCNVIATDAEDQCPGLDVQCSHGSTVGIITVSCRRELPSKGSSISILTIAAVVSAVVSLMIFIACICTYCKRTPNFGPTVTSLV